MFMRTPVNLIAWKTADFMVEHVPTPSQAGKVAHVPKAHAKYYNASMGSTSMPQRANAFKIQTHAAVLHVKNSAKGSAVNRGGTTTIDMVDILQILNLLQAVGRFDIQTRHIHDIAGALTFQRNQVLGNFQEDELEVAVLCLIFTR